jgi:BMFP domain-containing protein YqiC
VRAALAPFVATREEFEAKLKPLADTREEEEES